MLSPAYVKEVHPELESHRAIQPLIPVEVSGFAKDEPEASLLQWTTYVAPLESTMLLPSMLGQAVPVDTAVALGEELVEELVEVEEELAGEFVDVEEELADELAEELVAVEDD